MMLIRMEYRLENGIRLLIVCVLLILPLIQNVRMLSHPVLTIRVQDLPEPVNVFHNPKYSSGYYRVLLLDNDSGKLYVGGAGHIYRLQLKNINSSFQISEELPLQYLTVQSCKMVLSDDVDKEALCRNHIRVIVPKRGEKADTIYVCGTGAQSRYPDSYLLNKTSLSLIQNKRDDPSNPDGIHCLGNPNGNLTATVVVYGNPGNIPALYMATDQIRRPAFGKYQRVDSVRDPLVLNYPQFVSSFATEKHVYFWFRELKYERSEYGKVIYSRVARVTKNDIGAAGLTLKKWQSFTKARLNCSQPGEFPYYFDEIRDVYKDGNTIYAVFTTSLAGPFASAVCGYRLEEVEAVFNSGKFQKQPTPSALYPKVLLQDSITPQFHAPLYVQQDVVFRKLVMHRVLAKTNGDKSKTGEITVFYLGTNQGDVYKVSTWTIDGGKTQSHVLARWRISDVPTLIWDLKLHGDHLYVATDERVVQMDVRQCGQYQECTTCHRDPHCGWDPFRHTCQRYAEGHIQSVTSTDMSSCDVSRLERREVVLPGEPFHLPCRSRFGVDDFITWYHNGRPLPVDYRKYILTKQDGLMVMDSNEGDGGEYMCKTSQNLILHQYFVNVPACTSAGDAKDRLSCVFLVGYRRWCTEFEKYKRNVETWQCVAAKCPHCAVSEPSNICSKLPKHKLR